MNHGYLMQLLLGPCISEKSMQLRAERQYVFRVKKEANKKDILQAIKYLFEVEVESVHVANVQGKRRKFKNVAGKRSDWKKAYVKLKDGHAINLGGV